MIDRAVFRNTAHNRLYAGLLFLVMVTLLLLLGNQIRLSYRDQVRAAESSTHNIASIFEARLEATLRRIDADLKALAVEIPLAALNQKAVPRYARDVNAWLDSRMFNMDEMAGYRVHDAHGDSLYSSDSARTQKVNVADREYFIRVRDNPNAGLVLSDVVTGRSTGLQVIVVVRALRDKHGRFMGIVHGMVNLGHYRKQFQMLDLGTQGIAALRRSDNHALVVRFPDLPGRVNKQLAADHPIVRRMASGEKEISLRYSAAPDFIPRIMSIERMHNYPFYFSIGVGQDEVLAGWRTQIMTVVVSILLLFGLVGTLLFYLWRMRVRETTMLNELAQSELQFQELAQMVPVGICHLDNSGKYTYVNDRHALITGCAREDVLGRDWLSFVHREDRERIRAAMTCSRKKGACVCEYRVEHPDGQLTHVLAEFQADKDVDGQQLGYIAALTDISLLKQTEAALLVAKQQAESADMAKTRFLAAASHDLRQPIQAINLFRDALSRTRLDADQKSIVGFLARSVHSLGELLYALLDISKLDAGQVRPQIKAVAIEDVFRAVDAEFSSLAQQKGLRFKLYYPFKEMSLFTDPGLMMSVLRNLLDNALKYTERGGLLVGARRRDKRAVIQVWDTGIGIDPCYGEQVFEECFQVGNPVRDRTKGLGLGLAIVRRTARLLNCQVSYRSSPGRGTVFEIVVPLTDGSVFCDSRPSLAHPGDLPAFDDMDITSLEGWHVVVIEDDPMVAKSIELSLGEMGFRVSVFHSGEQALAGPESIGADFYISDFNLPGQSGLQVLDTIQRHSPMPIRAVLVTGEARPERVGLSGSARWPVLFKPVELSRLLAAMMASIDTPIASR